MSGIAAAEAGSFQRRGELLVRIPRGLQGQVRVLERHCAPHCSIDTEVQTSLREYHIGPAVSKEAVQSNLLEASFCSQL